MAKPFILPGRTRTGNAVRPPQPAKPVGLAAHVTLPGEAQRLAGPSRKMEERMVLSDALTLIRKGFDQAATDLEEGRGNVALCRDGCGKCCITNTPFANGLEAQHAVTTMGVSTEAIQRARDWLTHKHPQATIYPRSQPAVLYGVPAAEFTPAEVEVGEL
ncbi:MAG: hypothetical protein NTZ05_01935, partial [Chloroflexi bacterium]|nr:hypothetical protein [Chloroflexota bacterium]